MINTYQPQLAIPDNNSRNSDDFQYYNSSTEESKDEYKAALEYEHSEYSATTAPGQSRQARMPRWTRAVLLVANIGYLGFSFGASAFSHQPTLFTPFKDKSCYISMIVAAILTIIWAVAALAYCDRRHDKMAIRYISWVVDFILVIAWGAGMFAEVVLSKFSCPVGGYKHWCDFYNTSIFFGFVTFIDLFVTLVLTFFPNAFRKCKCLSRS